MLQRVKENYGVLSPRNFCQPVALSQIKFCEEEDQKGGINSKHMQLIENSKGGRQRVRYHDCEPRATPAFRFSISRLPKWAQTKVTSPEIVPCNLEFPSSQVFCIVHSSNGTSAFWFLRKIEDSCIKTSLHFHKIPSHHYVQTHFSSS